jgi:hypothetical protein
VGVEGEEALFWCLNKFSVSLEQIVVTSIKWRLLNLTFDKSIPNTLRHWTEGKWIFQWSNWKVFYWQHTKAFWTLFTFFLALVLRRVKYLCMFVFDCQANELPLKSRRRWESEKNVSLETEKSPCRWHKRREMCENRWRAMNKKCLNHIINTNSMSIRSLTHPKCHFQYVQVSKCLKCSFK